MGQYEQIRAIRGRPTPGIASLKKSAELQPQFSLSPRKIRAKIRDGTVHAERIACLHPRYGANSRFELRQDPSWRPEKISDAQVATVSDERVLCSRWLEEGRQ